MRGKWIFLIAASLLMGCSCGEKHLLRLNLKEGQLINMREVIETQSGNMSEVTEMMMHLKVIKAKNKEYTILQTFSDIKAPEETQELFKHIKKVRAIIVTDDLGKVKSFKLENAPYSPAEPGDQLQGFLFPEHPISPGETWDSEKEIEGKKIRTRTRFVGIKKINNKDTYYFSTEALDEHPRLEFKSPVYTWINPKDGMIERAVHRVGVPDDGVTITTTLERR